MRSESKANVSAAFGISTRIHSIWLPLESRDYNFHGVCPSAVPTDPLAHSSPEMLKAWMREQERGFARWLRDSLVQHLSQEIRTTSYLLHPPLLDGSGLTSALRWYAQGLEERSGLDIDLNVPDDFGRFDPDMELALFRLVQECLTNIHRHSGSKKAIIRLRREGDKLRIDVQDYGKGIPPEQLSEIQSHSAGVGIRGMREHLRQFGGELAIDSGSSGTTISAVLPSK